MGTTYEKTSGTVIVHVAPTQAGNGQRDLIDADSNDGLINYGTARYPTRSVKRVEVVFDQPPTTAGLAMGTVPSVTPVRGYVLYRSQPRLRSRIVGQLRWGETAPLIRRVNQYWYEINVNGQNVYITTDPVFVSVQSSGIARSVPVPPYVSPPANLAPANGTSSGSSNFVLPPPGVRIDYAITPVAGLNASPTAKINAVLSVAAGKIGTPYIWGHNEDRGQYGFDCSNFTEYVYHHALGYIITTYSKAQYTSVGVAVPFSQMQPGDLIAFEQGAHVGIYAGNNRMIQCGGGLHQVGYISIAPGTYWGNHISAIKRMF